MVEDAEREHEQAEEDRRRIVRRQFYYALFYLGTLLAVIGWYIDLRGAGAYSTFLEHLTLVAMVGHVLQVIAAFALLVMPDAERDDPE